MPLCAEVVGGPEVKSPTSPSYFPRLGGFATTGSPATEGADTYYLILKLECPGPGSDLGLSK